MSGLFFRPFPIVISAPSGAGKTSLAQSLVQSEPDVEFSVSATTRKARPGEESGRDYLFADDAEFDRMLAAGELLEWANVHGRRYGTTRTALDEPFARGKCVLLDIDVQGARQVRAAYPDAVLVFVLPPSVSELARRLAGRRSESDEERHRRLETGLRELDAAGQFDYVVVNDDFDAALASLRGILAAERQRISRYEGLEQQLEMLRGALRDILQRS